MPVDTAAATERLMRFLAIEGVTGQEAAIGRDDRRGAEGRRRAGERDLSR